MKKKKMTPSLAQTNLNPTTSREPTAPDQLAHQIYLSLAPRSSDE
jgi:hypothetical protein